MIFSDEYLSHRENLQVWASKTIFWTKKRCAPHAGRAPGKAPLASCQGLKMARRKGVHEAIKLYIDRKIKKDQKIRAEIQCSL